MTLGHSNSKSLPPKDLNATVWLHQNSQGEWFAIARVLGHVDLIPISDSLASILRDRWAVA